MKDRVDAETRKSVRAEIEAWLARRHWVWLLLILVVTGGYVELPNLPIVVDDWVSGFLAASTALELSRRVRNNWASVMAWLKALPGRVWRRFFGTSQAPGRG